MFVGVDKMSVLMCFIPACFFNAFYISRNKLMRASKERPQTNCSIFNKINLKCKGRSEIKKKFSCCVAWEISKPTLIL